MLSSAHKTSRMSIYLTILAKVILAHCLLFYSIYTSTYWIAVRRDGSIVNSITLPSYLLTEQLDMVFSIMGLQGG